MNAAKTCSPSSSSAPIETKEYIIENVKQREGNREFTRLWEKGRVLGSGGFASVYEFKLASTGQTYAAKVINKSMLSSEKNRAMILSEVKIHKMMSHTNIVKFEHCFQASNQVYILLELCSCSTLKEFVRSKGRLSEHEARYYMIQILNAVAYMHDNNIMHRDLKIGNMFLTQDYTQLKIGDFGLSTIMGRNDISQTTIVGTPNYLAPEILFRKGYSSKIDVYSIGCCFYAMLYGRPPFDSKDVKTTYRNIKSRNFSFSPDVNASALAKNLINKLLAYEPDRRPTCRQVLADDFFTYVPIPQTVSLQFTTTTSSTSVTYPTAPIKIKQPIHQTQIVVNTASLVQTGLIAMPKLQVVTPAKGIQKSRKMRTHFAPTLEWPVIPTDSKPDSSLIIDSYQDL